MRRFLLLSVVCLLAGCRNRYYEWGAQQFEQAEVRQCPHALTAYVQFEDRYDAFNLVTHCDILWYSFPVLEWHLEALHNRAGLSTEHIQKLCQEAYKAQKESLIFYLLISDDTGGSLRPQLSVNDQQQAKWSASMAVGKRSYEPISIKKVMIPSEIGCLFGNRFDPHYRISYKIVFPRYDEEDDLLEINPIHIELKSVNYTIHFAWDAACIAHHCRERAWLSNLQ